MADRVLGARWVDYEVVASQLGRDVSGRGASLAAGERIIADPLSLPT
jgi:hypothetical protein